MIEKTDGQARVAIVSACLVGTFARFFWHFVAGYIFLGTVCNVGTFPGDLFISN
ncbi:hypothetical protein TMUPMC115_0048 [Tetragenococcus muriaticus PMC-11-5]|uniref:Uncharacterized protein n=1 Tax=Tetragenococcus muriaticus PMC-11-5 TaxID=1302649 RepID=A0A091C7G4_9ENTE|nr:hypothetical protein TMUPMC115_0048 [Tetragenococcus muriaticus PMC-11-5]